jgi:hypothetical protein
MCTCMYLGTTRIPLTDISNVYGSISRHSGFLPGLYSHNIWDFQIFRPEHQCCLTCFISICLVIHGLLHLPDLATEPTAVATGRWGCLELLSSGTCVPTGLCLSDYLTVFRLGRDSSLFDSLFKSSSVYFTIDRLG